MRVPYLLFLALLGLALSGCSGEEKKEEELRTEVMLLHDEVMPEMSTIMQLKKRLKQNRLALDSIRIAGSSVIAIPTIDSIFRLEKSLDEADREMMNWMRNYKNDLGDKSHEEKMAYLREEKKKIEFVKKRMQESIDNAKAFLNKSSSQK